MGSAFSCSETRPSIDEVREILYPQEGNRRYDENTEQGVRINFQTQDTEEFRVSGCDSGLHLPYMQRHAAELPYPVPEAKIT
ncbi:Hypothetical predicted protein [Octopus vulgaris]|uniref:Uncharacterized protein n=1 Tax=Octopus vulgaris TaxID=6645 RepID=A0AA36BUU1_OCTVU|nr:Hypothetical predicted protein [Octopus vulgaris]